MICWGGMGEIWLVAWNSLGHFRQIWAVHLSLDSPELNASCMDRYMVRAGIASDLKWTAQVYSGHP